MFARATSEEVHLAVTNRALSALNRIGVVLGIAVAFFFSLAGTVYLSLRSSEVKVPNVVGKDRMSGESAINDAGLNFRVRATRPSNEDKPDTILVQLPRAGDVVKVGQTVAVDVSRAAKEGESSASSEVEKKPVVGEELSANDQNDNQNRRKRNKNSNNVNNNANNINRNANANRNSNDRNANNRNVNNRNANNRNANAGNRNANSNANRNAVNSNTNRRAPANSTSPFVNPSINRREP